MTCLYLLRERIVWLLFFAKLVFNYFFNLIVVFFNIQVILLVAVTLFSYTTSLMFIENNSHFSTISLEVVGYGIDKFHLILNRLCLPVFGLQITLIACTARYEDLSWLDHMFSGRYFISNFLERGFLLFLKLFFHLILIFLLIRLLAVLWYLPSLLFRTFLFDLLCIYLYVYIVDVESLALVIWFRLSFHKLLFEFAVFRSQSFHLHAPILILSSNSGSSLLWRALLLFDIEQLLCIIWVRSPEPDLVTWLLLLLYLLAILFRIIAYAIFFRWLKLCVVKGNSTMSAWGSFHRMELIQITISDGLAAWVRLDYRLVICEVFFAISWSASVATTPRYLHRKKLKVRDVTTKYLPFTKGC